jgi:Bacterial SH3 domain
MAKSERPLTVDIPRPGADQPAWSRVGIIGVVGFVVGIAWPRLAGVKVGPAVPADLRAQVEASASPSASAAPRAAATGSASAAPAAPDPSGEPDAAPAANQEMVVIGPGKIIKCWDKKDKKIDDCEKLLFDPIAVKRMRELSRCPSALGLTGKMAIGFEVDFGKKEVGVKQRKKGSSLPSSTVAGIVQCAAREFGNVSLEEVPHKHRHYLLEYVLTFYGPGKHPEGAAATPPAEGGDADPGAGSTTSEAEASGSAIIAWDTALLRKEPKDGEIVARLVRGTKVKIVGKQSDWFKIESGSKAGWVYRGTIGL